MHLELRTALRKTADALNTIVADRGLLCGTGELH